MYSEGTESPHNVTVGTVQLQKYNKYNYKNEEREETFSHKQEFIRPFCPLVTIGILSHLTRLPPSPPQHLISSACFIFKWSDSIGSPPLKSCPSALLNVMCSNTSIDKNSFVTFRNQHPIDWCPLTSNYDEALPLTTVPLTHKNRNTPVIPRL